MKSKLFCVKFFANCENFVAVIKKAFEFFCRNIVESPSDD